MDNELKILDLISQQNQLSQRDISDEIGISLGSVNILLKRMVREGLVKAEKIPANRVVYMLTPQGAVEKINKTVYYIKYHYGEIEKHQKKIRQIVTAIVGSRGKCYFLKDGSYTSDIVLQVLKEMKTDQVIVAEQLIEIDNQKSHIVLTVGEMKCCCRLNLAKS